MMCDRPLAAPGLTSYRARSPCGWVMIGARDVAEAWREAMRSTSHPTDLQVWDGERYVPAAAPQSAVYTIAPARYAKGQLLVRCHDGGDGWKTRAMRLIGDGLNCRWTGRERGYVASPAKVSKFERLYADGWDASSFDGELIPPRQAVAS